MTTNCNNPSGQDLSQLVDFFEARYNFNAIPYITYPQRVTNILYNDSGLNTNGITEAPYNGLLHGRINGQWQSFTIGNSYSQQESDTRYYPLNSNPSNYLITETDPIYSSSPAATVSFLNISNWNNAFTWGNHNLAGYALATQVHNPVTLGNNINGLGLVGQVLSLSLVSSLSNGAMSASDKIKLDSLTIHDPITLGSSNGLVLINQVLSLALATTSLSGAMSSADKIKLNNLEEYIHPTGFNNHPTNPLTGPNVISRIEVNTEGHLVGVTTRSLTANDLGIVPNTLSKTNDTNVTLTLDGNPNTSLLQSVTLVLGWTGLLAVSRGGTGADSFTSGHVLIGNGTSAITTLTRNGIDTRTSFPASIHTLTSHSDVNLTSPSVNQVLGFNGSVWTNITLDLNDFVFEEVDPVFTAFRDTVRTTKTFYAAPTGTNAIASFRSLVAEDLPDIYVRFNGPQILTELQKQTVRTSLGISNFSGSFEPAFSKGNVTTETPILTLTNGVGRLVGLSDLIINHTESGWIDKTTLATNVIISNLTVDEYGHISDWSTRILTLEDLGFVDFDPSEIQDTLLDHETRITTLETNFPTLNGDKNYVHVQSSPAVIWTFTHNLNKKPSVTIIDSAGSIILAKLTYIDLNNIEINFNGTATSGEAICN